MKARTLTAAMAIRDWRPRPQERTTRARRVVLIRDGELVPRRGRNEGRR